MYYAFGILIVINQQSFVIQYAINLRFFSFIRSFVRLSFGLGKKTDWLEKIDRVIFKCSNDYFIRYSVVFFFVCLRNQNNTQKSWKYIVTRSVLCALIKIIIFRFLSNPSRERKKKLCNFFCYFTILCVFGHACLSFNDQWKFLFSYFFLSKNVSSHTSSISISSSSSTSHNNKLVIHIKSSK